METPDFKHVANLWSLTDCPSSSEPWELEEQLDAVKAAGFDGFTTQLGPQHAREAEKRDLFVVGYFSSGDEEKFADLLKSQRDAGAHHVNVQLADHDTSPSEALRLTLRLMEDAERIGGLEPAIEVHRENDRKAPPCYLGLFPHCSGQTPNAGRLCRALVSSPGLNPARGTVSFSSFQWSSLSGAGHKRRAELDPGSAGLAAICRRNHSNVVGG
jgi:hypothetical protein